MFEIIAAFALAGCAALGYEVYCLRIKIRNAREDLINSSERNGKLMTAAQEATQLLRAANERHIAYTESVQKQLDVIKVELTSLSANGTKLHALSTLFAKTCSYWPGYATLIKSAASKINADESIVELAIKATEEMSDGQQS